MRSHAICLALGTNLGDRAENLRRALVELEECFEVTVVSPTYETEPVYHLDQGRFLNQCCMAATALSSPNTLAQLKQCEATLGRTPGVRFGPRLIDLDLLFYDDLVLTSPDLTVPHPLLHERAFVLVPLNDIAPELVHPAMGVSVRELLDHLPDGEKSKVWAAGGGAGYRHVTRPALTVGSHTFEWGAQTYVMGILNVTPDSFSGDGLAVGDDWVDRVVALAEDHVAAGAHVLDIGGESTRPGSHPVPLDEELRRTIPAVRALAARVSVPISIDTYKAEVARQAIAAGATIINDVWGFRMDDGLARVAAETGVAVVLMHNRSRPSDAVREAQLGGRYVGVEYRKLFGDIKRELSESIELALRAGVREERLIVDPGIGFGKTVDQNLELVARLTELTDLGHPLLVGPSRKSFLGYTLKLPPDERIEGTAAAVTLCIDRGADIVRVHDVAQMARVARIADAIVRRPS